MKRIDPETMALVEARAKEMWLSDPTLREEFLQDQDSYICWCRAEAMGIGRLCGPGPSADAPAAAPIAQAERAPLDPNLPVEERCAARWRVDPAIRAEFGSLEAFTAYTRADEAGLVHRRTGVV